MHYTAEITALNAEGQFVHFMRDADMPCAFFVRRNLPIILARDEGYRDVRVLAVQKRERFDVPVAQGRE